MNNKDEEQMLQPYQFECSAVWGGSKTEFPAIALMAMNRTTTGIHSSDNAEQLLEIARNAVVLEWERD